MQTLSEQINKINGLRVEIENKITETFKQLEKKILKALEKV